ncbi:MAG: uroporphyrinogen decarboxylase, partial [Clostridiales bacterium]|nr:uroporphyrinogen decarboxylase [Clostridiales bacterium]NLM42718.1 uroporphyrinogen decarboxylase [Clostridiales bacterium]
QDAMDQVEDKRLIYGPGCCVPLYVNEDRFEVAKELLKKVRQ